MSLRFATLGLLAQHPASGYDLLKRFEASMANVWPATQSQLYGELNKLAADGLIEVTAVGARGRKEYGITDSGRAELLDWIARPRDNTPIRRPDVLRVFLLGELPVDDARTYLDGIARAADETLAHYEDIRDSVPWQDCPEDFYARAALEYGLRSAAMEADWARWLIGQIDPTSRRV
ncbi:PadR family transcriptional regulator [Mycobacterium sp. MS1601]|uniref:PadR family transcriptional regulator n=1 Tax=Mycobacterium sp. MS1601 TaxID=1936029 RepID=UPI00097931EA|nr:PadR family transcriptional regulator [Mycobacterium sp. MS1601]AQA02730.1 PadR family transcriptional regulator [Mycobacterium sp. MS1601]